MDLAVRVAVVVVLLAAILTANAWYRRRSRADAARHDHDWPAVPAGVLGPGELAGGSPSARRWLVFTTPVCAACRQVEAALLRDRPGEPVVLVDATAHPELAGRYDVRRAPTTLAVDARGQVGARLVGVEEVLTHLGHLGHQPA